MQANITRKAVLIGCPGNRNNFLRGVEKDLNNVSDYLCSDKGGRWFPDEIITLKNPTYNSVHSTVHSAIADYVFIYFSGHGFTTSDNKRRMLALRDKFIEDTFLLNRSPRQLIVIDACRNYVAPGISGIPDLGEQYFHFDGIYASRELFDKRIANSPFGKKIIHATQIGKYSYDSPNGGYFTQALLNISTRIKATDNYTTASITKIIEYIPAVLQKQNIFQIPSVTYEKGNLTVPFAIGVPNARQRTVRRPQPVLQSSSNDSWVGIGLLALLFIGLAAALKK